MSKGDDHLPLLKSQPKQPKSATIQIRVEGDVKLRLDKYAEFMDSSAAYVVTEALKLLFNKDGEFKSWLGQHAHNSEAQHHTSKVAISKGGSVQHGSRIGVNPLLPPSERSSLNDHEGSQSGEPMSSIADSLNSLLIEPEKGTREGEGRNIRNPASEVKGHTNSFGIERPLTCEEAADLARVHPRTLKRMARCGELPGHFRFGRWFFYASELDCWMRTELHSSRHSCR